MSKQDDTSGSEMLRVLIAPLLATYALLPASVLLPVVDSTRPPYVDLTSGLATASYWLAESGGPAGLCLITATMLGLLVSRPGLTTARRIRETLLVLVIIAVFGGGGAALNEHVTKPFFHVPRPNVAQLAGPKGTGPLGMSAEDFYATGDKAARRDPLRRVLEAEPAAVRLSPAIREHWISETGYSFPSGHSFSAMFFATFFVSLGALYVNRPRRWLFYLLLPWAAGVCYSRPILRVHTPLDITVGGAVGLLIGTLACLVVRKVLSHWDERAETVQQPLSRAASPEKNGAGSS